MIQAAICEDSLHVQAQLEQYIEHSGIPLCAEIFSSGEELLDCLETRTEGFSIYFMDISLPGINGIETAAVIRRQYPYALILFVTDYKEYVYRVFEVLPFRFLIKPVAEAEFLKALNDAVSHLETQSQLFSFCIARKTYQIPCQEIYCFEADLRRIILTTADKSYNFYGKLRDVAASLNTDIFVQTHMSYLVNMEYIHYMAETELLLRNGKNIPISRRYRAEVKKQHLQYLKRRCGK
ncbi:LytTR family DNA-binding domain-containing protein [Bariatricus massiliensis]|uniref:Stage 0 sporulation protein A homolog n=1 Tax=Bariatricus massiliensis TaxID=1745713 RepID=A0ABS8DGV8_9FIRM|nr:LytTR family DNA-binding domain-containing protein [Bariatricus massiliensis]MCB7304534.1 LytTR family DNA-binding domain-containing protein [Bariatricus massiliensis]MCB7375186.1 LytTR family DNA-binding domain-containing protein [Bariatricus massiliensis]MCB7387645.1 LytTR family DNA-binding domain-containing protein [Bariatricus massiliensis]MCB7411806.1 LytTR family DNA-binding domain-containing protein [Bariatricus massiliensis]MCQ5253942.1 LytTR family DNA-binding domain-containing pr